MINIILVARDTASSISNSQRVLLTERRLDILPKTSLSSISIHINRLATGPIREIYHLQAQYGRFKVGITGEVDERARCCARGNGCAVERRAGSSKAWIQTRFDLILQRRLDVLFGFFLLTDQLEFFRHLGLFENWAATYIAMNFVSGMPVLFGFAMTTGGPKAAFANWTMIGG